MRIPIGAVLLCAGLAQAQTSFLFPELSAYLELTAQQSMAIEANYQEHNRWYVEKLLRFSQVRREIATESAKETLDPLALGVRAVELATICREVRERSDQVQERNLSLMNPSQKAKMKVLQDALSLVPVISTGQRWLVVKSTPAVSANASGGSGGFDLPSNLSLTGCSADPFAGNIIPVSRIPLRNSTPEPEQK